MVSSLTAEFGVKQLGLETRSFFLITRPRALIPLSPRAAAGANRNDLWVIIQCSIEKQCPQRWRWSNDTPSDEDKQGNVIRAVWSMSVIFGGHARNQWQTLLLLTLTCLRQFGAAASVLLQSNR